MFRPQFGKDGLIIDERFNSGGQIPDRFVELLNRPLYNFWGVRDGIDWQWPPIAHTGAQVMLINALYASPQGAMRMSDALPDLVETSNNLGVANVQDGQMEVICVPRSSVDSSLEDASQMIASVWELAGYEVAFADYYPGWNPDPESPILDLMEATYQDLYGEEPEVIAVHAGLECGVIGSKYPGMDMISIGPTLNDVHSPAERLLIPSVGNVMELLSAVLQNIPEG